MVNPLPWAIREVNPTEISGPASIAVDIVDANGDNVAYEVLRESAELIVKTINASMSRHKRPGLRAQHPIPPGNF